MNNMIVIFTVVSNITIHLIENIFNLMSFLKLSYQTIFKYFDYIYLVFYREKNKREKQTTVGLSAHLISIGKTREPLTVR